MAGAGVELISAGFVAGLESCLAYWADHDPTLSREDLLNVFVAVSFGLEYLDTQEIAVKTLRRVFPSIEREGNIKDWVGLVSAREEGWGQGNKYVGSQLKYILGHLSAASGNHQEAVSHFNMVIDRIGGRHVRLRNEAVLGIAQGYWALGDFPRSLELGKESLTEFLLINKDGVEAGVCLNTIGLAEYSLGNLGDALANFRRALKIFSRNGNLLWAGRALNNIGVAEFSMGDIESALRKFNAAAKNFEQLRHLRELGKLEVSRGLAHLQLGNNELAASAFDRAILPMEYSFYPPMVQGWYYYIRGYQLALAGDHEGARSQFDEGEYYLWQLENEKFLQKIPDGKRLAEAVGKWEYKTR